MTVDTATLDAERARLTKALAAAEKERDALAGRLGNASFVWLSKKPELPTVMRESFLRAEPLGTLTVPVVPGWKLQYHATLVQGYMGYTVPLPKAQGTVPVGQRNR